MPSSSSSTICRQRAGKIALPDGDTLEVTNLDKVFWPKDRRTKGDLLRYYTRVAPLILPVLAERPLVMKRLPNSIDGPSFYQHRAPEPVRPGVRVRDAARRRRAARLIGGSLKTLLYMAQLASMFVDPFFSTVDALSTPNQVAIDLNPGPGATFAHVLDVARWVGEILEARVGVPGFPKTSGSEGLHIFIPLQPGTPSQAGMLSAEIVATMVATAHPKVATVERAVGKRKPGTIYVDYLQNIEGKTLACAYSARGSASPAPPRPSPGPRCTTTSAPRCSRSRRSCHACARWAICGSRSARIPARTCSARWRSCARAPRGPSG